MRLGVNVPNFGPGTNPDGLARWAQTAEQMGLDLLMMSDHVAVTDDVATRYPAPFYEPFTTLAWVAGVTGRIGIGTTVLIMPYRHPLLTARMAGNLDRLSGGRLVLGVGVGWAEQEFAALGVPFRQRGAITDDYLAALRACWADDVAEYHGEFTDFAGIHTAPRPRAPNLWIGGNSDSALRRAVRFGDAWHPLGFGMVWLNSALGRLAAIAEAASRPVPALAPRVRLRPTDARVTRPDREAGHGTLAQILDDLVELRDLGAQTVVLDPYNGEPSETLRPEDAWRTLATVTEQVASRAT
ncbi:MAG TPA: TIGR03619 family F420-dependent LLM class oxidoreductase [Streptosporangiaceae bacterium]